MNDETTDRFALSQEQRNKIAEWLKSKKARGVCSSCGHVSMNIASHLVAPTVYSPKAGVSLGGLTYPMAMAVCPNCYHVNFHAVVPMKVLEPEPGPDGGKDG